MRLTTLGRMLSGTAALGLLTSSLASAGVVHVITPGSMLRQQSGIHVLYSEAQPNLNCPSSKYFYCTTLTVGKKQKIGICYGTVNPSGQCNPAPGSWTWSSTIQTLKGKTIKWIKEKFNPNPGNPTNLILLAKKGKSTNGKVKYVDVITVCNSVGSCASGNLGIAIK